MTAALVFGAFTLIQPIASTSAPWTSKVLTDGTNRGNPVPIEQHVQSWLQDGAIVVTQGYDNREVQVKVKLTADTLLGVGAAEKALFAEIGKPNTLSWTPNVALVAPVVFVVITSSLDHLSESGWDLAEVDAKPSARYQLRLVCEAFVRSATETITAALPATGSTTTLVDDGSATTGWTGTVNGTSTAPAVSAGAVGITTSALSGGVSIALTRTGSVNTSTTPYLVVDWRGNPDETITASGAGTALAKLAEGPNPTDPTLTRTTFQAGGTYASLTFVGTTPRPNRGNGSTVRTFYIDNISRSDISPGIGSGRQLLRTIAVTGSARTPGSVAIEHATTALGDVLAYFWPDDGSGYSPPMRQYRVSGGTVSAQAGAVSGSTEPIGSTTVTFDVPISRLPYGSYVLMARVQAVITPTITWTTQTRINGTNVGPANTGSIVAPGASSDSFSAAIYALARFTLPDRETSKAGVVRVTLVASSQMFLDEAWLFNTSIGQLVAVRCGNFTPASGGPANRVFIDPAVVTSPRPQVLIGTAADRSDAFAPTTLGAWQQPIFTPPQVNVLTVTGGVTDASVTFRRFDRWHTFPDR